METTVFTSSPIEQQACGTLVILGQSKASSSPTPDSGDTDWPSASPALCRPRSMLAAHPLPPPRNLLYRAPVIRCARHTSRRAFRAPRRLCARSAGLGARSELREIARR
ncbi:hypothetical protein VTO73DRAFT_2474 [Trametes versicolor]